MANLMLKAQQHMNTDDTLSARQKWEAKASAWSNKRKRQQQVTQDERGPGAKGDNDNNGARPRVNLPSSRFQNYTPLSVPIEKVFLHLKDDPNIKWPERIRAPPKMRNCGKYCHFHQDHSHDNNDYFDLKEQIDVLIQRG